jgi:hypothetical protein
MRLKSHAFKTSGILALAVTLFSVLPGPIAHAVEIVIEPPTVEYPVVLRQFLRVDAPKYVAHCFHDPFRLRRALGDGSQAV